VLLVDLYYERPEARERHIRLLKEKLQRQLEGGRLSQPEADAEAARFADITDAEELEKQLLPLWEKNLRFLNVCPGMYVILLGCNPYLGLLSTFQQMLGAQHVSLDLPRTVLQRGHSLYRKLKGRIKSEPDPNPALRVLWGIWMLKRRIFRRVLGHESLMGLVYYHHLLRRQRHLKLALKLTTLYVHHRLVVMRVGA
jgi:hypothetical protein